MKSLLLNGATQANADDKKIHHTIIGLLKQNEFHINDIPLRHRKVVPCQGCFDCWINSPGICRINDYGRTIVQQIVQSDLVIYLTPITFGGYSSEIKKVLDRSIPVLLPFFRFHHGEIHHTQRYEDRPCIIVIGYQTEETLEFEKTFKKLTQRNALNFKAPINKTLILSNVQKISELENKFKKALNEVKTYYE
jgi:multimeric flavodoxin WrbA